MSIRSSQRLSRALALLGTLVLTAPLQAAVDYLREIKPLLTEQCSKCHGASQQKGDLRLDTAAFAQKGGENGVGFKPGQSSTSLLMQAVRGTHDTISQMPYKKPPLSEVQMALLAKWIDEGATAPADEKPETSKHWAFVPPTRPLVPPIKNLKSQTRNPIDAFILARLEKEKLSPAPEADRATLLRRLNLDLVGLPPTPEEVTAFANDKRADAYERAVERLLASPHYGERWGRWWLDAARYADSNGYSIDAPRQIWKYRDWVVAALNNDMPFDQFAIWQLAGDLVDTNTLPPHTSALEPLIATGFNRNTQVNQEGGIDPEQFRVESVMDRVNTFGTVFLGLTVACAQCHDHKFDPISQKEYYQLYAFFNSTVQDGHGSGTPGGVLEIPGEIESEENIKKELEETRQDLDHYLNAKGSAVVQWEESLTDDARAKLRANVRAAMKPAWAERTREQKRTVYAAFKPDDAEFKSRNTKLTALERGTPKRVTTLVMQELKTPRETHLFTKGDFTRPADPVTPGMPAVLHPLERRLPARPVDTNAPRAVLEAGAPNRLDLARWTVDPANPLLARVTVNRVWQQYFGRGFVETENDFGTQGSLPTHPELLDWLACEFRNDEARMTSAESRVSSFVIRHSSFTPWSLKHLHRLIVTSATYRQSSRVRPELATVDPLNKLLARQSRVRLDAEAIRDNTLFTSGLLSPKLGGPPVYPPQPDGVMNLGQSRREWKASTGDDRHRRALYTHFWRATPHPALAVFDAPDGFSACTRRIRSNTPLQALTLLNDQQFTEFADALAQRALKLPAKSDDERIAETFRLCLARTPNAAEQKRLQQLLAQQLAAESGDDATRRKEAWKTLARVLLNLDETITRE
jgi:mono/diheme cytochrome c family protein